MDALVREFRHRRRPQRVQVDAVQFDTGLFCEAVHTAIDRRAGVFVFVEPVGEDLDGGLHLFVEVERIRTNGVIRLWLPAPGVGVLDGELGIVLRRQLRLLATVAARARVVLRGSRSSSAPS